MDLFDQHLTKITEEEAPLAARMRPRTKSLFTRYLLNQSVNWSSTVAFLNIST
ncbi:MAG: hypothetical protein V7L05_22085 [Nostoc sp.]|uniref:hypothetical protein n=1 Tax=Nostoc sp. TaxID=1180 RepID=UPI002FF8974E